MSMNIIIGAHEHPEEFNVLYGRHNEPTDDNESVKSQRSEELLLRSQHFSVVRRSIRPRDPLRMTFASSLFRDGALAAYLVPDVSPVTQASGRKIASRSGQARSLNTLTAADHSYCRPHGHRWSSHRRFYENDVPQFRI
jgi:hypothetical protein